MGFGYSESEDTEIMLVQLMTQAWVFAHQMKHFMQLKSRAEWVEGNKS